ncbi:MAG: hypothetical protein KKC50_05145, partial [Candidatus Omnitrophica bacterium]|nr:hypothetical protein [Candidatus Omnitrophota bacterium]
VTRRTGEKMAIIRLEDLNNFIEVLVFPKTYEVAASAIKEDALVYVDGRLNLREETPKIVAESIIPLEKVKELFTKAVVVKLTTIGLEKVMMSKVKFLIQKHSGKVPVYIDLLAPEGRKVRLSTGEDLAVTPKSEFLNDMEALVGAGNVKFITK